MLQIQKNICIVQYLFFSSYINHKPQTIYTTKNKVIATVTNSYQKIRTCLIMDYYIQKLEKNIATVNMFDATCQKISNYKHNNIYTTEVHSILKVHTGQCMYKHMNYKNIDDAKKFQMRPLESMSEYEFILDNKKFKVKRI